MQIALVFCGVAVFLAVWGIRVWVKSRNSSFSPKVEAVIRFALCILLALISYLIFGPKLAGVLFWATFAATAFLIYGITHFLDRLFLKE